MNRLCVVCNQNNVLHFYTFSLCKLYYCSHCFHTSVEPTSMIDQYPREIQQHPILAYTNTIFYEEQLNDKIVENTSVVTLHAKVLSCTLYPQLVMRKVKQFIEKNNLLSIKIICLNNTFVIDTKIPMIMYDCFNVQHHYSINSFKKLCNDNNIDINNIVKDGNYTIFTVQLKDDIFGPVNDCIVESLLSEVDAGMYSECIYDDYKDHMTKCATLLRILFCPKVKED